MRCSHTARLAKRNAAAAVSRLATATSFGFALDPPIAPPTRRDLNGCGLPIHRKSQADGGGQHRKGFGCRQVGAAILEIFSGDRQLGLIVQILFFSKQDGLAFGGQDTEDIAPAHGGFGRDFSEATGGAGQVLSDQRLQFGLELVGESGWIVKARSQSPRCQPYSWVTSRRFCCHIAKPL